MSVSSVSTPPKYMDLPEPAEKKQGEEESICSICFVGGLLKFHEKINGRAHLVHECCMDRWVLQKGYPTCPECRTSVNWKGDVRQPPPEVPPVEGEMLVPQELARPLSLRDLWIIPAYAVVITVTSFIALSLISYIVPL